MRGSSVHLFDHYVNTGRSGSSSFSTQKGIQILPRRYLTQTNLSKKVTLVAKFTGDYLMVKCRRGQVKYFCLAFAEVFAQPVWTFVKCATLDFLELARRDS